MVSVVIGTLGPNVQCNYWVPYQKVLDSTINLRIEKIYMSVAKGHIVWIYTHTTAYIMTFQGYRITRLKGSLEVFYSKALLKQEILYISDKWYPMDELDAYENQHQLKQGSPNCAWRPFTRNHSLSPPLHKARKLWEL